MDLILILLILFLLFGGGWGYRSYGPRGGIGIGGLLLILLIVYLLFGRSHLAYYYGGDPNAPSSCACDHCAVPDCRVR